MRLSDKFRTYRNWDDFDGYIQPKNTDQIVITDDGKVGIGIITPQKKLHVNGDVQVDRDICALNRHFVSVKMSSDQTFPSETHTIINFDIILNDTYNEFDINNHRWTCSRTGLYLMIWFVRFKDTSANVDRIVNLYKNGEYIGVSFWTGSGLQSPYHRASSAGHWLAYINQGDYFELRAGVWGDSGGIAHGETQWSIIRLG